MFRYSEISEVRISSVQLLIRVLLFATPWIAACQASLSITKSWSLLRLMSIESVIPSNHLILCHPLLLLPSIFPSIRVFSNESALCIRWPKYWSFSFSISPSSEYSVLISFMMGWLDLLAVKWVYLSFSPLPFTSLLHTAICKTSSDSYFAFLHFFFLGMVLTPVSCSVTNLHP